MARRINPEDGGLILLFGYRRCQGVVYALSGGRGVLGIAGAAFISTLIPMLLESDRLPSRPKSMDLAAVSVMVSDPHHERVDFGRSVHVHL